MAGIQHTVFANLAPGGTIVLNWPPSGDSGLTTIFGTHAINGGTGHLQVTNTAGTGSAYTYVTALSSTIADFVMEADGFLSGTDGVAGLVGHAAFTATDLDTGYRFDVDLGSNTMRLFRADATSLTQIATPVSLPAGYYQTAGNAVTYHMSFTGTSLDCWLSASGQSDTSHITATSGTYATGRCGLLSFRNIAGSGGPIDWTRLSISS
jgi:hypothetical protein